MTNQRPPFTQYHKFIKDDCDKCDKKGVTHCTCGLPKDSPIHVFDEGIEIEVITPIDPICKKHNYRLLPQDAECRYCVVEAQARAELAQEIEAATPRYLKGGEPRTQYFAKGWNECKEHILSLIQAKGEKK